MSQFPTQDFQQKTQAPDTSQILIGIQAAIQGLQLNMKILMEERAQYQQQQQQQWVIPQY